MNRSEHPKHHNNSPLTYRHHSSNSITAFLPKSSSTAVLVQIPMIYMLPNEIRGGWTFDLAAYETTPDSGVLAASITNAADA